tara:strand:+ start:1452 stop:4028 length:2577 start_codon:yes stop_codon:yes gene_type:complete
MNVLYLQQCNKSNADQVGGKALGLGELIRFGLPVPAGFSVTTNAYRQSVVSISEDIATILEQIGCTETDQSASEKIIALFNDSLLSDELASEIEQAYLSLGGEGKVPVAVRSSATAEDTEDASFAGQQDTYLWIIGIEAVKHHIVRCWASLFTDRAIGYRARQQAPVEDLAMGVVVQRMVPAESAGVMMTLDPVSGDRSCIYIESAFGLGESVVGGGVEPDRFHVLKNPLKIKSKTIASKKIAYRFTEGAQGAKKVELTTVDQDTPSLSEEESIKLARLGMDVEQAFGKPMDVEWAIGRNSEGERDIYLVQARPETVWSNRPVVERMEDIIGRNDAWDTIHTVPDSDKHWSRTNIGEAMPGVQTPLSWSIWGPSAQCLREASFRMGIFSRGEREIKSPDESYYQCFYGRPALWLRNNVVIGDRMPGTTGPAMVESFLGRVPEDIQFNPTKRRYPIIIPKLLYHFITIPGKLKRLSDDYDRWWQSTLTRIPDLNYEELTQLFYEAKARHWEAKINQTVASMGLVQPLFIFLGRLAANTGMESVMELGAASGNKEIELPNDIWRVSRGEISIDQLVRQHGFHGPAEGELESLVWREDHSALMRMVDQYSRKDDRFAPAQREQEADKKHQSIEAEVLAKVAFWKRPYVSMMLKFVREYLPLRGVCKASFVQGFDGCRACARRMGELLQEEDRIERAEDVFYLTLDELCTAFPVNAKELISLRRARRLVYQQTSLPESWKGMPDVSSITSKVSDAVAGEVISGLGVSQGVVEGKARVLMTPDFGQVEENEILVTPTTDPSWSSIMFVSSAVVVDIGGALSHAAVVAREMNIPCVVNTHDGSARIKTGDMIRVNGTSGLVEIL